MQSTSLLTIPKFAARVGISYWLARKLVLRGDIPSIQVGPRKRISEEWIQKWLAEGKGEHVDVA
jgi:excisionase family DNA binding protein